MVALGSLATAAGFVAASVAGLLVAERGAVGWLPLHLLLAGGAGTAVAGVLPFFAAALAAGPPADPRLRVLAVVLVAGGALAVSTRGIAGVAGLDASALPAMGGVAFIAGMALVGGATLQASRRGLGGRRPLVALAYGAAIVNVLAGASLGTLAVSANADVLASWALLRPAHAWLNLVGFVSLVIAGTLLHLLPTVAGARIVDRPTARIAVGGLVAGPPIVAAGLAVAAIAGDRAAGDALVRAGALATLVAALALGAEAAAVLRARGRWTTDPGWHAMAIGSLVAGVGWFVVGIVLAAGRALALGADLAMWSTPLVAAALAIGWVGQSLVGSATHLLPAIGPGGPAGHAARRAILGRAAVARLVTLNAGVLLVVAGSALGAATPASAGLAIAGLSILASIALGVAAGLQGSRAGGR